MRRKECQVVTGRRVHGGTRVRWLALTHVVTVAMTLSAAAPSQAGTVRLWSEAVVVEDTVRLADVAELIGFDRDELELLQAMVVADAPPAGGARFVTMGALRKSVYASGVNAATLTLHGASRCAVSRPMDAPETSALTDGSRHGARQSSEAGNTATAGQGTESSADGRRTLREAAKEFLSHELARYGGEMDVVFDRASEQVLGLTDPPFGFQVRRRGGSPLGLTSLEVDVISDGRLVQTIPLVAQVTMRRSFVSAARAINQGATVRASDVALSEVVVDRLDAPWAGDPVTVVGQRAKRFIPQGTLLQADLFEPVPLVRRGELVTLRSVSGSIAVVTSGRAESDGLLGETITVRAADSRRVQYEAMVVGPGELQVGDPPARLAAALAPEGHAR